MKNLRSILDSLSGNLKEFKSRLIFFEIGQNYLNP
jgi:hypothetical protein